jgi:uncharacterized protein YcbX
MAGNAVGGATVDQLYRYPVKSMQGRVRRVRRVRRARPLGNRR